MDQRRLGFIKDYLNCSFRASVGAFEVAKTSTELKVSFRQVFMATVELH